MSVIKAQCAPLSGRAAQIAKHRQRVASNEALKRNIETLLHKGLSKAERMEAARKIIEYTEKHIETPKGIW